MGDNFFIYHLTAFRSFFTSRVGQGPDLSKFSHTPSRGGNCPLPPLRMRLKDLNLGYVAANNPAPRPLDLNYGLKGTFSTHIKVAIMLETTVIGIKYFVRDEVC